MQADSQTLHKNIIARMESYKHQNGKEMSITAVAQMLSNMLYYKRFFPYYTFNVLAGLDDQGCNSNSFRYLLLLGIGAVYSYDAVGSFQRQTYYASGSGTKLLIPVLDNQVIFGLG